MFSEIRANTLLCFSGRVMSKVEIPDELLPKLGAEMKMDVHWVDVKLTDGSVFPKMVVRGGRFITGCSTDSNGEGHVQFETAQISSIRRAKLLSWWPFW
jgi:hypothetical protein